MSLQPTARQNSVSPLSSAVSLLGLACLGLAGCGLLGADEEPFEWAERGNTFVYDFQPGDGSLTFRDSTPIPPTDSAAVLHIIRSRGQQGGFTPDWNETVGGDLGNFSRFHYPLQGESVVKRDDGLYMSDYRSCDGLLFYFTWLRVPSRSDEGQEIPFYTCGRRQVGSATVVGKKKIRVPAGEFEVFVLEERNGRWREYWNEASGLIRASTYDEDGTLKGSLLLSKRRTGP